MHNDFQKKLLDQIIGSFPKRAEAVEKLSTLLNIGKDAVYRRLRCDTLLAPEEVSLLARKFNISLDALVFGNSDSLFFNFNALSKRIDHIEDYVYELKAHVDRFSQIPDVRVYYPSAEIPIFYYCFYPEIFGFKMYVWGRTIWDIDYLQDKTYSNNLISPEVLAVSEEMLKTYLSIETTEIWNINIFDNTLNQIEYHYNSGGFKNVEDAMRLCDQMEQLADHLCKMAAVGRKFNLNQAPNYGQSFSLYHNEMISTSNIIYIDSPSLKGVFSTFASPNYITSTDARICQFTEEWIQKIITKSHPISASAERSRNWYFNALKRRIDYTRRRIQMEMAGPY